MWVDGITFTQAKLALSSVLVVHVDLRPRGPDGVLQMSHWLGWSRSSFPLTLKRPQSSPVRSMIFVLVQILGQILLS